MRVVEVLNAGSERLWVGIVKDKPTRHLLMEKVDDISAFQVVDNLSIEGIPDGETLVRVAGTVVGFIDVEKANVIA